MSVIADQTDSNSSVPLTNQWHVLIRPEEDVTVSGGNSNQYWDQLLPIC